ncbi:FecR family protein [Aureivirga marina]|uniref:FecR family protein n=1 Tax=Aureivirga marina TaxID=1182451 RepID=UPI0018CB8BAA|nr:FecR domain-containing protein [Aureivirga marina]
MKTEDNIENKDVFLAQWIAGEISDLELKKLVSEEDFAVFSEIKKQSEFLEAPKFEMNQNFEAIKNQIDTPKKKSKVIPLWMYAAAASVVIMISFFLLKTSPTTIQTGIGEQRLAMLVDSSEVILNAKSKLTYQPSMWKFERKLKLEGEAYFKVKKGSKFTVETENGTVTVLGTQFDVNSLDNYFKVVCYEGKVSVKQAEKETILTQSNAYQNSDNKIEKWNSNLEAPSWVNGESTFEKTPLKIVIEELEKQYDINIDNSVNSNKLFTGTLSNTNLELALQTLTTALQLKYEVSEKNITITK